MARDRGTVRQHGRAEVGLLERLAAVYFAIGLAATMNLSSRRARLVVASTLLIAVLIVVAANNAAVRDALAILFAVLLVALFFGVRIIANWLRDADDRAYEFWGGMSETMDALVSRYTRPGGNPILPPDAPPGPPDLPDAEPAYHGHPLGQGDPPDRT